MGTHLEMVRAIGEVQDAPVLADIDTGFGDAVSVAYAVPRYTAAGAAAVVMEDKTFPKDSSLRLGGRQEIGADRRVAGQGGSCQDPGRRHAGGGADGGADRGAGRRTRCCGAARPTPRLARTPC